MRKTSSISSYMVTYGNLINSDAFHMLEYFSITSEVPSHVCLSKDLSQSFLPILQESHWFIVHNLEDCGQQSIQTKVINVQLAHVTAHMDSFQEYRGRVMGIRNLSCGRAETGRNWNERFRPNY